MLSIPEINKRKTGDHNKLLDRIIRDNLVTRLLILHGASCISRLWKEPKLMTCGVYFGKGQYSNFNVIAIPDLVVLLTDSVLIFTEVKTHASYSSICDMDRQLEIYQDYVCHYAHNLEKFLTQEGTHVDLHQGVTFGFLGVRGTKTGIKTIKYYEQKRI